MIIETMVWIEVTEQLPEAGKKVLFTDGRSIFLGILESHHYISWRAKEHTYLGMTWPKNITHWMYLPYLPNGVIESPNRVDDIYNQPSSSNILKDFLKCNG